MIDPLEKKGIPSLPVYIALLIIILYLAMPFLMTGIGISPVGEVEVQITVSDDNTFLGNAEIEILSEGILFVSTRTDSDGIAEVSLERGETYEIRASKANCGEESIVYQAPKEGFATKQNLLLSCELSLAAGETGICFEPAGVGQVTYEELLYGRVARERKCEGENCVIELDGQYTYRFKTVSHISETTYTKEELQGIEGSQCVQMKEKTENKPDPTTNHGSITIWLKDEVGDSVGGQQIKLVDAESTDTELASGITSEANETKGRVDFSLPIGKEFKVMIMAGENAGGELKNDTVYQIKEDHQLIPITIQRYQNTKIEVIRRQDSEPLDGAHVRIMEDDLEIFAGLTQNGAVNPQLKPMEHTATVFKKGYHPVSLSVFGGQAELIQMDQVEENEVANVRITVKTDTPQQERVKGAKANIKYQEGGLVGHPEKETNELGRATFEGIPEGDYCIELRWMGRTYPCSDNTITVRPQEESTATRPILVEPVTHLVDVEVIKDNERINGATVKAEDTLGQIYGPETTDEAGLASIRVPHGRLLTIDVDKTIDGDQYRPTRQVLVDEDKEVTFNLTHPVGRDVNFLRVTRHGSGETVNTLNKGTYYLAHFTLDLDGFRGERWNTVLFELSTEEPVSIYEANEVADWAGWDANPNLPGKEQVITISGEYSQHNRTPEFTVPFIVEPRAENEVTFQYEASWVKGTTTPQTGEKTRTFEVNEGKGSERGQFWVDRSIRTGGSGWTNPDTLGEVEIGAKPDIRYQITNLGDDYTGEITLVTEEETSRFTVEEEVNIHITRYTGEEEQIEEYELTDHSLKIDLSDTPLNKNDRITIQTKNNPLYPATTVSIAATAAGTELGKVTYKTGGTITVGVSPDPSGKYDLSNLLQIGLRNMDRAAVTGSPEPLTETTLRQIVNNPNSKITGSLEGCGEIPLSSGRVSTLHDGTSSKIIVDLDDNCKLKPGTINLNLEGGSISKVETSMEIMPAILPIPLGSEVITHIGETCPVEIVAQPIEEELSPISITPSECSSDNRGKMTIQYHETSGLTPENMDIENVDVVGGTELERRVVNVDYSQNTISFGPEEGVLSDGANLDSLKITFDILATNNGVSKRYNVEIDIAVHSIPISQQGGNRFIRSLIQSYEATSYNCRDNHCTLEQMLEYIIENPQQTSNVKMVNQGIITPSDVVSTLRKIVGDGPSIMMGDPGSVSIDSTTTDPFYIVTNDENKMPDIGANLYTLSKGTIEGKEYYYITFDYREITIEPFFVRNMALWLPHSNEGIDERKRNTPIYLDETLEEYENGELYKDMEINLKEAVSKMWGVNTEDIDTTTSEEEFDSHLHGIHLGICPAGESNHVNCQLLDKRGYRMDESLIFLEFGEGHGAKTHIIAPDISRLYNLTDRFKKAFGESSNMVLKQLNPDKVDAGALTFAPEEIRYYCYHTGKGICPGGDATLQELEEIGEQQFDTGAVELEKIEDYHEITSEHIQKEVDWVIVSCNNYVDLLHCGQAGFNPYIANYKNIFGRGVTDSSKIRLPEGGILYQPQGPTIVLVPQDNPQQARDLLSQFLFNLHYPEDDGL